MNRDHATSPFLALWLLMTATSCPGELTGSQQDGAVCHDSNAACQDGDSAPNPCAEVSCPSPYECVHGSCVLADPCESVDCTQPGEVCQGGYCVSGLADDDNDGVLARDDCDDTRATVYPGAPEVCNSIDDDCDETTRDGTTDCPGFCCGAPGICRTCCDGSQCGPGTWTCTPSFECECTGRRCGEGCYPDGQCCADEDCGGGEWTCSQDHQCTCMGHQCGSHCYPPATCCGSANCCDLGVLALLQAMGACDAQGWGAPAVWDEQPCWHTDSSGSTTDDSGGWATLTFLVEGDRPADFELDLWGVSDMGNILVNTSGDGLGTAQGGVWTTIEPQNELSGQQRWETLTYVIPEQAFAPGAATQIVGFGGGGRQIWVRSSRISSR